MIYHENIVSVSVVIPCYRAAPTIKRAVNSVISQIFMPKEIILVDDCSGDDTFEELNKISILYPGLVKVISTDKNQGSASARNLGWSVATQSYIAFLDADDAWHPDKIRIQYTYMSENTDVVLCGHGHRFLDKNEVNIDWDISFFQELNISKWQLLVSNRFVTPSVMLKRDIKQRFVVKQRYVDDHMLWLQIICSGAPVVKLTAELAVIYKGPFGVAGLSAQLWSMELGELKNYGNLYSEKSINIGQLGGLYIFSLLKYMRRVFIYWGVLRWQKK